MGVAGRNKRNRKALLEECKRDILFFINSFVWQFNPKKKDDNRVGPFITWDFQERALLDRPETTGRKGILWCYEHDRTAVVEKSREMGASWLFLIFQVWIGLFFQRTQCLNISRNADAVDCASPDSLFWKIRFIHEHLPDWMKGEVVQQSMYIEYKRTRSVNTGEASTGRAGVGGRASVIFIDEFSQIKEDLQIRQRTANTSDCRFFNGTHLGTDTEFYNLTQSPEIVKIVMHWSEHPDKKKGLYRFNTETNQVEILDQSYRFPEDYKFVRDGTPTGGPFPGLRSPWYDWKCNDIGSSRGVAMELDINPSGSVSQFFDPLVIRDLIGAYAKPPYWEGDLRHDRDLGKPLDLESRENGPLRLWFIPDDKGKPPPGIYAIGADVASGSGATPSCLSIGNCQTGEKVGEYVNSRIEPNDLAPLLVALAWLFKSPSGEGAKIAWEIPGPGQALGKRVVDLGYRNIFFREGHELNPKITTIPGWTSTAQNKRVLLEDYRSALRSRQFLNRSYEALAECLSFRYTSQGTIEHSMEANVQDPSGARLNHGDRTMADAIQWKLSKAHWVGKARARKEEVPVLSLLWRRNLAEKKDREATEWG